MRYIFLVLIFTCLPDKHLFAGELDAVPQAKTTIPNNSTIKYQSMGISELISELKAAKAKSTKEEIAGYLSKKVPSNASEINEMLDSLGRATDYEGDVAIRSAIKDAMRKLTDGAFASVFAKRIMKGEYESRLLAIHKVAEFRYAEAVPDLMKLAKDVESPSGNSQNAYIKLNAFNALGEIGDERALPFIWSKFGKMNGHDAQALSGFGIKVLPRLFEVMKASNNRSEKESAGAAISYMKDKAIIPLLWEEAKAKGYPDLRNVAIGTLLRITDEMTTPRKQEVLDYLYAEADTNKYLRPQTLGIAKKNNDVKYLLRIMNDKGLDNRGNRGYAFVCLGEMKAKTAIPDLEASLTDPDREIRIRAASTLKLITGKDYPIK